MQPTLSYRSSGGARLLLVALTVVGLGALPSTPAFAHSALKSTNPKASSTVAALPDEVSLTFNEQPLAPGAVVRVTDPSGAVVSDGKPKIGDRTVTQGVRTAGAPAGAYKVAWRVTSEDGHPISGTFGFTARSAVAPPAAATPSTTTAATAPTATTGAATASATSSPTPSARAARESSGTDTGSRTGVLVALAALVLVLGSAAGLLLARRARQAP